MRAPHEPFRFERVDSLDGIRKDWARLAELSGNVFLTWEWMAAWRQHRSAGSSSLALAGRDTSGALAAIVPLSVTRRGPLRIVRLMGHGPADELGPVCAPEQRARVRGAASRALAEADAQLFLAEQLPGGYDWSTVLDGKAVRWEASPVIRAREGGWEGYIASRSANFREQVRSRERRLHRRHEVAYRRTDDPARLRADLELLFTLHRARWRQEASAFRAEPFHFEFARAALERGWLRLWFLELDGHAVAAWYGLRFGDVEVFYQSGRDPRWERESVGFVLLAHTIREALDDGMSEYRLLRGDEPYKYRFADADPGVATVATGRGVLGNAVVAAGAARRRLARRVHEGADPTRLQ